MIMPSYDLVCFSCKKRTEVKMSFAEHDDFKSKGVACPTCGEPLIQAVAPLKFKLEGAGWFVNSQTCVDPYGMTETEVRNNLDMEKRVEEGASVYREMEKKAERLG
jgi:predicted nucleic acid-binding Zn ribbon protein